MNVRTPARRALCAALILGMGAALTPAHADPDPVRTALDYLEGNTRALGLGAEDVRELEVLSMIPTGETGISHVYVQQYHQGIPVNYAIATVNVLRDGSVINPGNRFVSRLSATAGRQAPSLAALDAVNAAIAHVGMRSTGAVEILRESRGATQQTTFTDGGVSETPIEAMLTWHPTERGDVRLAWTVEIASRDSLNHWFIHIDAGTGETLGVDDLVVEESARAIGMAVSRPPSSGRSAIATLSGPPEFPETDGASYFVYPYPFESPTDGAQTLVTNVADPAGSPLGWHDDGTTQYTITRGNNVHAYTDVDANGQPDPGSEPDGGALLIFDAVHDQAAPPQDSRDAAVNNLFYWNNVVHDVSFNHGFDEASGNFQVTNFGPDGLGGDDVRAEAQDGSGTNNANFLTPSDGNRPRMQMYVWNNPNVAELEIYTPAGIADIYSLAPAGFGPGFVPEGLDAPLALANDGSASPTHGCDALVGFPAGHIAVIDRGTCEFGLKGFNAQNAGAVGLVVVNSDPGNGTIAMGGGSFGPQVIIPSGMIGNDDGSLIKAELGGTVDGTMRAIEGDPDRDSDFDAGIIAHEYAHGISNRLTGGANTTFCLNNAEQMGEGWSDWYGIVLTTSPEDTALTPRGVGTYATFQPADGNGIRPTPYSTDMSVNPSTYASVADPAITQPHGIGYVWNTMLWETYWNLVHRHGYNPNIYQGWDSAGNNLAVRLVQDGMKMQPCRPGFVDGRDGILAADEVLTGGTNQCEIWRGFAKRGLGFSADQGSSFNRSDGVEAFDLPDACTAADFGGFQPPVASAPAFNAANAGSTIPVKFSLSFDSDEAAETMVIDTQPVDCGTLLPTGEAPIAVATPGATNLKHRGDQYHLNWQTDGDWAGTCRSLTVRIPAESDAVAYFAF